MRYQLLILAIILAAVRPLSAQYAAVNYDINYNWFNQGQPLPAETDLVFTGKVPTSAEVVRISILSDDGDDVLHTATWHRSGREDELTLPVNYKLRSSNTYDFEINFYGEVDGETRRNLREQLVTTLHAYLEAKQKDGTSISFSGSNRKITREMNELIAGILARYQSRTGTWNRELSDLVPLKLERMDNAKLTVGYDKENAATSKEAVRLNNREDQLQEMRDILSAEVDRILSVDLLGLREARVVDDYATEHISGSLALNFGYGGAFLSGSLDDGNYGSAPYVGIGFPLGNRVLGTKFFRNASMVVGVFVNGFTVEDDRKVEGFLIDQPLYVGLDYKLFHFVHLNAGATTLDGRTLDFDNMNNGSGRQFALRPFVGLSARINLAVGLGR